MYSEWVSWEDVLFLKPKDLVILEEKNEATCICVSSQTIYHIWSWTSRIVTHLVPKEQLLSSSKYLLYVTLLQHQVQAYYLQYSLYKFVDLLLKFLHVFPTYKQKPIN